MTNTTHDASRYAGPERRRHKVYVTQNSEYHCRDGTCVAVRNRRSGIFVAGHVALGRRLRAGVRFDDFGAISSISRPETPRVGDQICFCCASDALDTTDVVTSPLETVERPSRDIVRTYSN
jgi:hypothetical protein